MLASRDNIVNGSWILDGQCVERDEGNALEDMTNTIRFSHGCVNPATKGEDVLDIRGVCFPGKLHACIKLFLGYLRADVWGAENLPKLVSESRPVREGALMVKKPSPGNVSEVECDAPKLVRIIPPVRLTHSVIIVQPVVNVFTRKASEHGGIALPRADGP